MRLGPELYTVLDDPRETRNPAAERPELVAELQSGLDTWWPLSR
jgi:hypothetical protein